VLLLELLHVPREGLLGLGARQADALEVLISPYDAPVPPASVGVDAEQRVVRRWGRLAK
jgi:hypothetical protein